MNSDTLIPFATITIGEIVDVLLVAILVYTAIVWLRRTRAAFVVRGILILGAAYMLVRYLDLQMTAWIFQAFFAVFVVMIVVIFQEELRQMFERIAVWSFTRQPVPTATSASADIVVHVGRLGARSYRCPGGDRGEGSDRSAYHGRYCAQRSIERAALAQHFR